MARDVERTMAFRKLLLASYEVPTFFRSGIPGEEDVPSLLTRAVAHQVGTTRRHALLADAWQRAVHLGRVLRAAQSLIGPVEADTLPVLMAPEFFFRHPERPYTEQEFFEILDVLREQSQQAAPWLLVPGTCWWGHPGVAPRQAKGEWLVAPLLHNTVLALWGGRVMHVYLNRCWRDQGGFTPAGPVPSLRRNARGVVLREGVSSSDWSSGSLKAKEWDSAWLDTTLEPEFQGLSFGFETGAEHLGGGFFRRCEMQSKRADVHFLLACGLSIHPLHVAARSGGYVLHGDGRLWEVGGAQGARVQAALRIHRQGDGVERMTPVPVLQRLEEPVDAIGEHLGAACRERGIAGPMVVLYQPFSLPAAASDVSGLGGRGLE